ncbi:MAG: hypothetical protein ABIJ97_12190 [Bacteroidota bacterium]
MKTTILFSAVLIFISLTAPAQNKIVLMNGNILYGKISDLTDEKVVMEFSDKKHNKTKKLNYEDIFSITYNETEFQYYSHDPENGNNMTVIQMKYYLQGMNDAKENYHAPLATIGGLVSGITGVFFGFYGIAIPTGYVFAAGIKTPEKPANIYELEIVPDFIASKTKVYGKQYHECTIEILEKQAFSQYYNEGYVVKAKDKKIKNAFKGTIIGFIGFAVGSLVLIH